MATRSNQSSDQAARRRILLIGGAGYIGSVLTRRLLACGYRVKVLDAFLYDNASSLADLGDIPSLSFQRGDFCQPEVLEKALLDVTDVVLLAALVGDPLCRKYPELARRINQDGAIRLFDTLDAHSVDRAIFLSTCSNYGLRSDGSRADEDAELNPQSLYAETKVNLERHILTHGDVHFCPVLFRLATAYGFSPRMRFDLTISDFTRQLTLGHKLCIYDENTWRPYCHVRDISTAIIAALEQPSQHVRGRVFNVGSNDQNYTKQMIVDIVLKTVNDGRVSYGEGERDPRDYRVSFDRITETLGFRCQYSVDEFVPRLARAIESGFFDDVETRKNFYGNYIIEPT